MTTLLTATWIEAESVDGYRCQECDWFEQDEPESPLFECGQDGERFDRDNSADGGSNRCPQCNKFAAKLADHACPECQGEVEQVTAYLCPACDGLLTEDQAGEDETCPHCSHDFDVDPDAPVEEPEAAPEPEPVTTPTGHAKTRPVVTVEVRDFDGPRKKMHIIPYKLLKWITDDAILHDRNRKLNPDYVAKLNPEYQFPVVMTFPHRDGEEMRLVIDFDGSTGIVDVDWNTYNAIPEVWMPDHSAEVKEA